MFLVVALLWKDIPFFIKIPITCFYRYSNPFRKDLYFGGSLVYFISFYGFIYLLFLLYYGNIYSLLFVSDSPSLDKYIQVLSSTHIQI